MRANADRRHARKEYLSHQVVHRFGDIVLNVDVLVSVLVYGLFSVYERVAVYVKPVNTAHLYAFWAIYECVAAGVYISHVGRHASWSALGGLYFGAWLGTYDDIKTGAPGQYRILLSKCAPMPPRSNGKLWFDGYYPSLHYLPDGTIIATTYECLDGDTACSIVSHRFKLSDIENNAK